jgi:PEP-CTERM motif
MPTRCFRLSAIVAASVAFYTAPLGAQTYSEAGDAGQTLGTAQYTGATNGQSLLTISGTLSGINDADLYYLTITAPTTFSASTVGGSTLDTVLFLFGANGVPIYANDDASGLSLQSTLPAGSSFTMTLSAGTYLLGISLSGNEPINLNGQLLFAGNGGNSTAVRGPAGGINPNTLSNFNNGASFSENGPYSITLASAATAAVPEPSTVALGLVAAGVFAAWKSRSRKVAV